MTFDGNFFERAECARTVVALTTWYVYGTLTCGFKHLVYNTTIILLLYNPGHKSLHPHPLTQRTLYILPLIVSSFIRDQTAPPAQLHSRPRGIVTQFNYLRNRRF